MTPRKPLPYHALQAVDAAIMENTMAVKALEPIILDGKPMNLQELFRLVGKAIIHTQRSSECLKGINRDLND